MSLFYWVPCQREVYVKRGTTLATIEHPTVRICVVGADADLVQQVMSERCRVLVEIAVCTFGAVETQRRSVAVVHIAGSDLST